jgi:hypothetical protein
LKGEEGNALREESTAHKVGVEHRKEVEESEIENEERKSDIPLM